MSGRADEAQRPPGVAGDAERVERMARRHLRAGWWALLVFVLLGVVLEGLHAFKAGAYVDADAETRRLLLRLAHAHGTLLSVLHVVLGLTIRSVAAAHAAVEGAASAADERASRAALAALILVPGGFFAGAVSAHGGDPGVGIVVVLPGAFALAWAIARIARRM